MDDDDSGNYSLSGNKCQSTFRDVIFYKCGHVPATACLGSSLVQQFLHK